MILSFRDFLNESAFSNFHYALPDDPEKQLYDFYMLDLIRHPNRSQQVKASTGMYGAEFSGGEMGFEDYLNIAIEDTRKTLLPAMKKNMLQAMFFSLSAEMRHTFTQTEEGRYAGYLAFAHGEIGGADEYNKKSLEYEIEGDLKVWRKYNDEFFRTLLKRKEWYDSQQYTDEPDDSGIQPEIPRGHRNLYPKRMLKKKKKWDDSLLGRQDSHTAAIKAAGDDPKKFVEIASSVYHSLDWQEGYGGKAWGYIADGWLKLDAAKDLDEMATYIDHAYDLQHNNGTVFDKIRSYYKSDPSKGGLAWLARALDFKRDIKQPHSLIRRVSRKMKKLALPALKIKYNTTLEDMLKKNPEELHPDTKEFKQRNITGSVGLDQYISQVGGPEGRSLAKYAAGWAHVVIINNSTIGKFSNLEQAIEGFFWSLVKHMKGFSKREMPVDYFRYKKYSLEQFNVLNELQRTIGTRINFFKITGGIDKLNISPDESKHVLGMRMDASKINYKSVVGDLPVKVLASAVHQAENGLVSRAHETLNKFYPIKRWSQQVAVYLFLVHGHDKSHRIDTNRDPGISNTFYGPPSDYA